MGPRRDRAWALRRRMLTQRLASAPAATAGDVVRTLLAVQCQDAPLAAWSLGLRSRAGTYAAVLAEQDTAAFVRTHVLRPTWHYVAAEDLRWLLELTSARIQSSMAARHRQLELDARTVDRGLGALGELLADRGALTRKQIGPLLAAQGLPGPGERVGHLLLLAELRGLVCSGPLAGREHTYALLEQTLPVVPDPPADRDEALGRLVGRFFSGHGPAGVGDLLRWAAVNKGEIRRGLDIVGDGLEHWELDGEAVWFDPATPPRMSRPDRAHLLPTFDEVVLTYAHTGFPRPAGHPRGADRLSPAEAGGGMVVCDGHDVGTWKRTVRAATCTVDLELAPGLDDGRRAAVDAAAQRLADFVGLPLSRAG